MTPDPTQRRLAAIMAADMVGYSRLMEIDEESVIARQRAHRDSLIDPTIARYNGRIVKLMGDGMLIEFPSVVDAVRCAVDIQKAMGEREADVPESERICYRIGINLGDIVIDGDDILGDGVNVAARLEGIATPGGICISDVVHQSVAGKIDTAFEDLGGQKVKNIERTIRAYRVISADKTTRSGNSSPKISPSEKPSIAVLAFSNMSGDPEQEYFSDGIAEDIITGLSHNKELLVIARNSSFTYKGQQVDLRRVGEELGVRYVLEGSVRRGGDRVRVTGQLIDTSTGGHVWADRYDGKLDDVFELQDNITAQVLSAIGTEITLAEVERARSGRTDNVAAWDLYLRALPQHHQVDRTGNESADRLLMQAIEMDPAFSSANAMLALNYISAAFHAWGVSATAVTAKAEGYAQAAIALDQQNSLGHVALGYLHMFRTQQERSVRSLRRALELNPNNSMAYGRLANAFAFLGRTEEALDAASQAFRGSPRDPERYIWHTGAMNAHFAAADYENCTTEGEKASALRPSFYGAHFISSAAFALLGRMDQARQSAAAAMTLNPRLSLTNTAKNPMFEREADVARLLDGLKRAGVPE